jgi:aryl-alcohol dehydrogenase-like predicted oxidoreductase
VSPADISPERIRRECDDSLRRLKTDYIDVYHLHEKEVDEAHAIEVRETLESLVHEGKIRFYGWSTDDPLNAETLQACEQLDLASINRSPLSMGLLTGKFSADTRIPVDDVRSNRPALQEGRAKRLAGLDAIRAALTSGGRSLAQVEENVASLRFGPLAGEQMQDIARLLR